MGASAPFSTWIDMKVYRCQTCGNLLNDNKISEGECAGHRITLARHGTLAEWFKVKVWAITEAIKTR
jgi:DNA-directed RNA polymerase subunit RPC12/RpoP